MSEEELPPYTAGLVIMDSGNRVHVRIVALDSEGQVIKVLQGISLTPETARASAERLTMASWKVDDRAA